MLPSAIRPFSFGRVFGSHISIPNMGLEKCVELASFIGDFNLMMGIEASLIGYSPPSEGIEEISIFAYSKNEDFAQNSYNLLSALGANNMLAYNSNDAIAIASYTHPDYSLLHKTCIGKKWMFHLSYQQQRIAPPLLWEKIQNSVNAEFPEPLLLVVSGTNMQMNIVGVCTSDDALTEFLSWSYAQVIALESVQLYRYVGEISFNLF